VLGTTALEATIELTGSTIDICLTSTASHDVDLGLLARLACLTAVHGCIRIEGPLIRRISVFGSLDHSATTGMAILAPTAGYSTEVNVTLTPHSFDLMASGNMVLTAVGHALDVAAYAHLFKDFQRGSAEGEVSGRIDCHSAVAGLAGEGQATWYVDDSREFLQGRLSMAIFNLFGGARLEGGLFIGSNCPRERAWVLLEGGEKFGVSSAILPNPVTGIYGYGQLSLSVNWYVFGGGVDISLGLGFFDAGLFGRCGLHVYGEILGGLVSASAWANLALLLGPPLYFEGSLGLRGCIAWVLCASIEITAGYGSDGFYLV